MRILLIATIVSALGASACGGRSLLEPAVSLADAGPSSCSCDDGIACTRDACPMGASCTHSPDDSRCPDTQLCTPTGCRAAIYVTILEEGTSNLALLDLVTGGVDRIVGPNVVAQGSIGLDPKGALLTLTPVPLRTPTGGLVDLLLTIDRATGVAISSLSVPAETGDDALTVSPDGSPYVASSQEHGIERIDRHTSARIPLRDLPPSVSTSGDLAFFRNRLYFSASPVDPSPQGNDLFWMNLPAGALTDVGSLGYSCVSGLAVLGDALLGVTCEGFVLRIGDDAIATELFHLPYVFDDAAGR